MMKIIVVVDAQNDFITGPLGSQDAIRAAAEIERFLKSRKGEDDIVYFTRDSHTEEYLETAEGKKLPVPHCIFRTEGWRVQENLWKASPSEPVYINKSTFGSKDLANSIWRNVNSKEIDEIIFVGFCTDICVISNALMVKAFLPEVPITVYSNCCAGTSATNHLAALNVMEACQIDVKSFR